MVRKIIALALASVYTTAPAQASASVTFPTYLFPATFNFAPNTTSFQYEADGLGFGSYSVQSFCFDTICALGGSVSAGGTISTGVPLTYRAPQGYAFNAATFYGTSSTPDFRFALRVSVTNALSATVPEPASWIMMIVGFGAMGVAMRRSPAKIGVARHA